MRDLNMRSTLPTRRDLLVAAAAGAFVPRLRAAAPDTPKPVVGIVKIRNGKIDSAVEQAIELLGGMRAINSGIQSSPSRSVCRWSISTPATW